MEDKKVMAQDIVPSLISLKKKLSRSHSANQETITVQADKSVEYSKLSSVIQACSQAGFSHIKFAVLGE